MPKKSGILIAALLALCGCTYAAEDGWLESYNQGMFAFNTQFNKYVLRPVARGYRAVTTPEVRTGVNNALSNVTEPVSAGNHFLQGSFRDSSVSVARFAINTTLGLGGLFDVAAGWGLPKNKTGFDATLATLCVPDGPYLVMPIIGPSTPRSLVGYGMDSITNPLYLASLNDKNYHDKITWGYTAVGAVASAESSIDLLDDLERNSVDMYSTMKSAYMQNRLKVNRCSDNSEALAKSYDFDFDDEDL